MASAHPPRSTLSAHSAGRLARARRSAGAALALALGLAAAGPGEAQQPAAGAPRAAPPRLARPARPAPAAPRPAVPAFAPAAPGAALRGVLPPLALPAARRAGGAGVAGAPRFRIEGIRIAGNTVLPDALLRGAAERYAGAEVTLEDLLALQEQLTRLYVDRGYVTSGAVLGLELAPDGFAEFRVTEGVLREVRVLGAEHYFPDTLRARLLAGAPPVVNVQALEAQLRRLQEDPRIARVEARLVPGPERGQADLDLRVEEGSPYRMSLEIENHQSPAVGEYVARGALRHLNLTGRGDTLEAAYAWAQGMRQLALDYERPLGDRGTGLRLRFDRSESEVVEAPFEDLGIESRTETYGFDLRRPLFEREAARLDLLASAEYRRSRAYFLGRAFSFSQEGPGDGRVKLAVLQLGQEFALRSPSHVLAARSVFRWGVDALGASVGGEPDGRFLAWLGQAQWAQRLPGRAGTLLVRGDLQLASGPLPGIEQLGIGGHASVRGYRENRLVRDRGWIVSAELRIPIWSRPGGSLLELTPFLDLGSGWNRGRETAGPRTLSSAGLGLSLELRRGLRAELYYAHAFRELGDAARRPALQDRGLHFRIGSAF